MPGLGGLDGRGDRTRLAGIIGWPVDESLSPAIHNAAFQALGLDWTYVTLPVPPRKLRRAFRKLRRTARFGGANVTMPHKEGAARLVDELTEDARLLRAVNTIALGPGGFAGHNTDAPGFTRFLEDDAGYDPAGRSALVLGAG
ncbi:MAG: shikimate dehydrogenase, partial [Actinomycetota bacterium]|nr:shikimate dehydrogenase [Actinomycetota bacterium]